MDKIVNLKGAVALLLVIGAGIMLLMLFNNTVPKDNQHFFDTTLGAWLAWTAMAVKRVLDGTDSSDAKNDTIQTLSNAVATAQTLPAADSHA